MKLSKIINSIQNIKTNIKEEIEINKITSDSRKIEKNDIFVAIKGENRNGNDYIESAIQGGASVIVTDDDTKISENYKYILVENSRSALSVILSKYYRLNEERMTIICITGTNGKSSTAYFLYNILRKANKCVGLISTIESMMMDERLDINGGSSVEDLHSAMTTPDPEILYNVLYKMKKKGVKYVVLESSSHGVKQRKLDGLIIDFCIFTNLSMEHMDYHKTMLDYFESKEKLIKMSKSGVVNIDNPYGKCLFEKYEHMHSFSYNEPGDFFASHLSPTKYGYKFSFFSGKEIELETKIPGEFNVCNASLAASVAVMLKIGTESIREGVLSTKVPGRMEKYKNNIYIDYAHTPFATEMVLKEIQKIEKRKNLVVLFGCGGDRDKTKREKIGAIVSKYANKIIITSDNPRNEEPLSIIREILNGVDRRKTHIIIPSRKEAIVYGVKAMKSNDVLVLLGKGHEEYEINRDGKFFFSEKRIIDKALNNGF